MTPQEVAAKREAAVQAMIAKGYTRERAEHLLFDVVGKAMFGTDDLPGMWEDADLSGGWADSAEQVDKLRAAHTKTPVPESVTTGRKKKTA